MTVATQPLLTYEQYMAEEETMDRYDIIDGVRITANPTRRHQRILGRIFRRYQDYEQASGLGQVITAPCDVLIRRNPLRTRQPDVLFISHEQLAKCSSETDAAPLFAGPELVVEILSPSETRRMRDDKIRDYCGVGVQECWVVSPKTETIEVLRLTTTGEEIVAAYGKGQTVQSDFYPDLTLAVEDIFKP